MMINRAMFESFIISVYSNILITTHKYHMLLSLIFHSDQINGIRHDCGSFQQLYIPKRYPL